MLAGVRCAKATIAAVVVSACFAPAAASAQVGFDVVGARALGMGGAFVAVVDDPSAVHWNPPGLIEGPVAGLTIGWDGFQFRDLRRPPEAGSGRLSVTGGAVGTWPLGISFLRTRAAGIRSAPGNALTVDALRTSQLGFTVLQSLGDFLVAGATLKYVRGSAANRPVGAGSAEDVLDSALDLPADSHGAFDLDVGLLLRTARVRAGLAWKNLRRPGFPVSGGNAIHLARRARLGLAVVPRDGLTLAIDVDLDTADPLVGLRRTIALGGETRLGGRFALRGGIRWQRGNASRPIGALGGSVSVRPGLWLDGYVTPGRRGDRGFGIAMRVGS